ncbi:MAG: 50S ribosomal protein L25 [Candidatus Zixiibacteriota bacterium]|nr:MAG: 50S ribosomal protein L25 [candidate division Zixibacteria bacterium]
MKEVTLQVHARTATGKGVARKLRSNGKLPAVIYGHNEEPVPVELEQHRLSSTMRQAEGEKLLINLNIDGKDSGKKALIKDIQRDPVSGKILHVDFQHISMDEKIKIEVPIKLEGTAEGVKNFGGIMAWNIRRIMVSCLPADIPDKISLDVSEMKIHDSIHVKEITAGKFEILDDPEETIVSIIPPTIIKEKVAAEGEEGEEAPEAAPEVEEAAEPEVISEKKAEEREKEKKE